MDGLGDAFVEPSERRFDRLQRARYRRARIDAVANRVAYAEAALEAFTEGKRQALSIAFAKNLHEPEPTGGVDHGRMERQREPSRRNVDVERVQVAFDGYRRLRIERQD